MDITQHLPKQSKTVAAIYAAYKKTGDAQPVRGYLGASIIGHECERYLWYCFRQCCKPEFNGRMYRLFETGELEEFRFVKNLESISCTVYPYDSEGKQFNVSAFGGHFSGHMDGCALGIPEAPKTWHVLEFKTHNAKSFRELTKKGVQESKPQHYAQMMVYMHLTGMKRALYVACNKDTDELYSERVRYNKAEAEELMERARRVITSTSPPERIAERPDWYACRWCDAKTICWGTDNPKDILGEIPAGPALPVPSLSCRQCCHATPDIKKQGGLWWCSKWDQYTVEICDDKHLVLPGLLSFAEPTDYGQDEKGNSFIEFTNEDGHTWRHGNSKGCYSSEELCVLPISVLSKPFVHNTKAIFGGTATDHQVDILQNFTPRNSRVVWKGQLSDLEATWRGQYSEDILLLTPLRRCNLPEYSAVEFMNARVAIAWKDGQAEIREGEIPF